MLCHIEDILLKYAVFQAFLIGLKSNLMETLPKAKRHRKAVKGK